MYPLIDTCQLDSYLHSFFTLMILKSWTLRCEFVNFIISTCLFVSCRIWPVVTFYITSLKMTNNILSLFLSHWQSSIVWVSCLLTPEYLKLMVLPFFWHGVYLKRAMYTSFWSDVGSNLLYTAGEKKMNSILFRKK